MLLRRRSSCNMSFKIFSFSHYFVFVYILHPAFFHSIGSTTNLTISFLFGLNCLHRPERRHKTQTLSRSNDGRTGLDWTGQQLYKINRKKQRKYILTWNHGRNKHNRTCRINLDESPSDRFVRGSRWRNVVQTVSTSQQTVVTGKQVVMHVRVCVCL